MIGLRVDWRWLVAALVMCVLFIPIGRYQLPVTLPFQLDPYRLLLAGLFFVWILSLLTDNRVRMRRSGLDGPLVLYVGAVVGSLLANQGRSTLYQEHVVKSMSVLVGVLLTFYFVVGVLRGLDAVEAVLRALVLGGAIVAGLSVVEARTGFSPFAHLERYVPLLVPAQEQTGVLVRGSGNRAFGSAEHPIALGALLALLTPLAVAFAARRRSAIWWVALGFLVIGAVSSVSRTAIVMLIASLAFFCLLQWNEAKRFLPLTLVVLALVHLSVPGALGALRAGLHPSAAVSEQKHNAGSQESAGRIADLGPSLEEFRQKPILGYGYGTRIVTGPAANARLLDDQWLGSLLDTGIVGVFALAWLFARFIGRLAEASSGAKTQDAVLLVAIASSALAYAVSMFTFDAMGFMQLTLVLFIVLAAGCALAVAPGSVFEVSPESGPLWSTPGRHVPARAVGPSRRQRSPAEH